MLFSKFSSRRYIAVALSVCVLIVEGCRSDKIVPSSQECSNVVFYSMDIRPLILTHCAVSNCHVQGFQPGDFTRYQPLKDKADNGRLHLFVLEVKNMPPGGSMTEEERQMIGCWIEQGSPNN